MKKLCKQRNVSGHWSYFIALCFLCVPNLVGAQENAGKKEDTPKMSLKQLNGTQNVLMGTQDPELSIQSISSVSGDKLLHRPTFMMESSLDGTLPGLYIDMSQGYITSQRGFRLRGKTPLILVDGIPRADVNIPASQIESVSVINDGLGLSMMGMSSGNGVVYIKTKRGQRTAMKIDFTAQLAYNQQLFRPDFLNAYQYGSLLNEALVNDGKMPMYSQTDLDLYRTGGSPYTHPDVDWQNQLLRTTAPTQQYNLNVSGGGRSARYFIDLNVYQQDGFLKQDNSINSYNTRENAKKYSLRTNTDISITDHTQFRVNLFGQMYRETTPGKAIMGSIYRDMYTTPNNAYPVFNPNGTLGGSPIHANNNLYGQSVLSGYYLYPKTDFSIDATLEHHFQDVLKGLYASATYSYNSSYRENLNRSKGFAVYSYWKDPTDPNAQEIYQQMASSSSQSNGTSYDRLNRLQYIELALGYDFNIKKHEINTKALYSYNDYIVSAKNIPLTKNALNFRAEYNYDRRYMAQFGLSYMNLNQLKPGEQWGAFPSVGAGWNIHKEAWFESSTINSLKLRSTFGINGSDGTGSYYRNGTGTLSDYYFTYMKYYNTTNNGIYLGTTPGGLSTLTESNLPYLTKWEKTTRWNIGLDTELFDRSLTASVEYFHNIYDDILQGSISKEANSLIGMTLPSENLGKYRRSGIEINMAYNKQLGDVQLYANANATFYQTEMLVNGENPYPESYMQRVGQKYGQVFGYVSDGFFQNQQEINQYLATTEIAGYVPQPGDLKYRDLNNDHILDGKDIKAIGTDAPLIEYGFYLGASWKGLALSMQWAGLGNSETTNKIMPFTFNSQGGYGQALEEHLDRWTPENQQARYPRLSAGSNSYNERTSTFWLQDASYLRLKNIELSYTLPKSWTMHARISGVKLFTNAYNILTISAIKDRDPELLGFTNGTSTGLVPNTKAYNFGINIQF